MGCVIGAAEEVHANVVAREVVDRRVVSLAEEQRAGAVGHHLASEFDLHPRRARLDVDAPCRVAP